MRVKLSTEYGNWIGGMDWDYMVTMRKNYRTNENSVKKVSEQIFNKIPEIDRMIYVGERDKTDYQNYHIHLLINSTNKLGVYSELIKLRRKNKGDTIYVEEIIDNKIVGMYITKYIDRDIVWDLLIKN